MLTIHATFRADEIRAICVEDNGKDIAILDDVNVMFTELGINCLAEFLKGQSLELSPKIAEMLKLAGHIAD